MTDILARTGWDAATRSPLAGDASARRYWRLHKEGDTAILMSDPDGDVERFARIARYLCGIGLSAPRILDLDPDQGLMLLEDLGDRLFARLADTPETEMRLYLCATDVLIGLHEHPPPADLPMATAARLATMIAPTFAHYAGTPDGRAVQERLAPLLAVHAEPADVTMLRDYHAENLLWLPERTGAARTGLLDFQDAMIGHRAYDLVSLLRDARRDVSDTTAEAAIRHYIGATGQDADGFRASLAVLGVQRNLRILGIFARLSQRFGKPQYVDLIPRVWRHLQTDLAHPVLDPVRAVLDLPAPDPAFLERLKQPCPTP